MQRLQGNICRSPMAEAVFQHVVDQRGLKDQFERIESAGTHSCQSSLFSLYLIR